LEEIRQKTDDSRVAIPTSPDPDRDLSGRQKREANDNQPATEKQKAPIRIGAGVDIAEVIMSDCSRESRFIGGGRIGLIELS
jgi:hypothetical protein